MRRGTRAAAHAQTAGAETSSRGGDAREEGGTRRAAAGRGVRTEAGGGQCVYRERVEAKDRGEGPRHVAGKQGRKAREVRRGASVAVSLLQSALGRCGMRTRGAVGGDACVSYAACGVRYVGDACSARDARVGVPYLPVRWVAR